MWRDGHNAGIFEKAYISAAVTSVVNYIGCAADPGNDRRGLRTAEESEGGGRDQLFQVGCEAVSPVLHEHGLVLCPGDLEKAEVCEELG